MIDKRDFSALRKEMDDIDRKREESITLSRSIIKLSKVSIYSVHRGDLNSAKKALEEMTKKINLLRAFANPDEGHFRTAMQEFVEAACFFEFASSRSLEKSQKLGVSAEHYLLGLCDLSGELVRFAINSAIKGDYKTSLETREFLNEIYGELLQFDFRNSELRRKFDGVKYDLKKLDDLAFDIGRKR